MAKPTWSPAAAAAMRRSLAAEISPATVGSTVIPAASVVTDWIACAVCCSAVGVSPSSSDCWAVINPDDT
jgi:hypothetical protein